MGKDGDETDLSDCLASLWRLQCVIGSFTGNANLLKYPSIH